MASSISQIGLKLGWTFVLIVFGLCVVTSGFTVKLMEENITFPFIVPRQTFFYSSSEVPLTATNYCNYTNPYNLKLTWTNDRTYCVEEVSNVTVMSPPFTIRLLTVPKRTLYVNVSNGYYVQIKCPINGARGQDIKWTFNNKSVTNYRPEIYVDLAGKVHIHGFNVSYEGRYNCRVNGTDKIFNHTTELQLCPNVEHDSTTIQPTPSSDEPRSINVNLTANSTTSYVVWGFNVKLLCLMHGTKDEEITWEFKERNIGNGTSFHSIRNFTELDVGKYSCKMQQTTFNVTLWLGLNPCLSNPCNWGECFAENKEVHCLCPEGKEGANCEEDVNNTKEASKSTEDTFTRSTPELIGVYQTRTSDSDIISIRPTRVTERTTRPAGSGYQESPTNTVASMAGNTDTASYSTITSGYLTSVVHVNSNVGPSETITVNTTRNPIPTESSIVSTSAHHIYKRSVENETFPDAAGDNDHYIPKDFFSENSVREARSSKYKTHPESIRDASVSHSADNMRLATSSSVYIISKTSISTDLSTNSIEFQSLSSPVLHSSYLGTFNYLYHSSMDTTSFSKGLMEIIALHTERVENISPYTRMSSSSKDILSLTPSSVEVYSIQPRNLPLPKTSISTTTLRELKVASSKTDYMDSRSEILKLVDNSTWRMNKTGSATYSPKDNIWNHRSVTVLQTYTTNRISTTSPTTTIIQPIPCTKDNNSSVLTLPPKFPNIETAQRHLPNGSVLLECICSNKETTVKWLNHGEKFDVESDSAQNRQIKLKNFQNYNITCSCDELQKELDLSTNDTHMAVNISMRGVILKESRGVNEKIVESFCKTNSPNSTKFIFLNGYRKVNQLKAMYISDKRTVCLQCDVIEKSGRFFKQECFIKVDIQTDWEETRWVKEEENMKFYTEVKTDPLVNLTFTWIAPANVYGVSRFDEKLKQFNYSWEIKSTRNMDLNGVYNCTISTPYEGVSWQRQTKVVVFSLSDGGANLPAAVNIVIGIVVSLVVFGGCLLRKKCGWLKKKWYDRKLKRMAVKEFNEIGMSITQNMRDRYVAVPSNNEGFPRQRLRLMEVLGEGNFGKVVKAEALDITGNGVWETVAIKMCKETATDIQKEDFAHELALVKKIPKHPNVVSYLGYCQSPDQPTFMILEYVSGGNLLHFLRKRRPDNKKCDDDIQLESSDLSSFAHQIAKGLEHLSTNNIIHRDVAARNILISEQNVCKVADLGLARELHETDCYEISSKGVLPIRWMAPESLTDGVFTQKSDVWSFGVLLWEIVTLGASPYPGMAARQVMSAVVGGQKLECPDFCSNDLKCLIMQCWEFKPDNRPEFYEICKTLEILLEEQTDYLNLSNYDEGIYSALFPTTDDEK